MIFLTNFFTYYKRISSARNLRTINNAKVSNQSRYVCATEKEFIMAFIYRQQNTGLNVINGTVKSIAEDGKSMVVATQERSKDGVTDVEYTAETQIPYEQNEFKKGYQVTVFGYGRGKNKIMADGVLTGQSSYEDQDISLVTGFVSKASYNPELKEDGTPKTKRDGSAKKPHYDITVNVHEGDKWVNHVIQIYDGKVEPGKKTPSSVQRQCSGSLTRKPTESKYPLLQHPAEKQHSLPLARTVRNTRTTTHSTWDTKRLILIM